jgi:riboflavin kinase/FMN adenylyltransferase
MAIFTKKLFLKVHHSINSYSKSPSAITIGTFDGVHLGHQKIIRKLQSIAQEKGLQSVILTFFPHPRMVLQSAVEMKLLNTIEERQEILSHLGLLVMITGLEKTDGPILKISSHLVNYLILM